MQASTFLFVINPVSGGKEKVNWKERIEKYFSDTTACIHIETLKGDNDKQDVKEWIEKYHPEKIVAVGGDGTVKMIAELVANTEIQLGILPAGSANGMAKELGIPSNIKEALKVIDKGTVEKIDAIQINDKDMSIHLSDIGLNALLIKYFDDDNRRGMWGYAKVLFRVLRTKRLLRLNIQLDDGDIDRAAFMAVIANARNYGTGAVINPEGNLHDSKFEVVVVRRLKLVELFKMLIASKDFNPDYIEVLQTKKATITVQKKTHFQVDGEYKGKVSTINAKVLSGVLNVLVPSNNKK